MSTARKMQASLYDWIVYQLRYKARERKGEKEDGWCGRLVQISCEGRQGASGNRDNSRKQYHTIWNCTRQYKTVCAVTTTIGQLYSLFFIRILRKSKKEY